MRYAVFSTTHHPDSRSAPKPCEGACRARVEHCDAHKVGDPPLARDLIGDHNIQRHDSPTGSYVSHCWYSDGWCIDVEGLDTFAAIAPSFVVVAPMEIAPGRHGLTLPALYILSPGLDVYVIDDALQGNRATARTW